MSNMEDSIKLIVEQVLKEIAAADQRTIAEAETQVPESSAPLKEKAEAETFIAADLSAINLRTQLLVPNPQDKDLYLDMKKSSASRLGVWRAGSRPLTQTMLRFRADHAVAGDSVMAEISHKDAERFKMVYVTSACRDKDEYLTRPDLGRVLSEESAEKIGRECEKAPQVQIIAADGLSSKALEANIPDLFPALLQGIQSMGLRAGTPVMAKYSRVGLMDDIGEILKPDVSVILIGERPGLGTAESMSAYITYRPRKGTLESERTVISNIHRGGTPAVEAGAHIASLIGKILDAKASGVNLKI